MVTINTYQGNKIRLIDNVTQSYNMFVRSCMKVYINAIVTWQDMTRCAVSFDRSVNTEKLRPLFVPILLLLLLIFA